MPYIGLRGMKVGRYVNTNGTVSYTDVTEVGEAISANMELTIAEGVLWAEDGRAEVMRKATGGNITLGGNGANRWILQRDSRGLNGPRNGRGGNGANWRNVQYYGKENIVNCEM